MAFLTLVARLFPNNHVMIRSSPKSGEVNDYIITKDGGSMSYRSLGDPFSPDIDLRHGDTCGCESCNFEYRQGQALDGIRKSRRIDLRADEVFGRRARGKDVARIPDIACAQSHEHDDSPATQKTPTTHEEIFDRAIDSAVVRAVFGQDEMSRRSFMGLAGSTIAAGIFSTIFPLDQAKAALKESLGPPEKINLKIGFVPITCATPIIMARPMGFYSKYGLNVEIVKTPGWVMARDRSLSKEYDASHMLTPMPLAITLGLGVEKATPFVMPAIENINGQAITLHIKHKDKRNPKEWVGFKFGVPFEYSMHNFLLRYYVAEYGLDPDKDIEIKVVPPPKMVETMAAGEIDGYLSPDPFNQRAVYDKVGFLHVLTKELFDGHPCCAFACSKEFTEQNPNTYGALLNAIVDATAFSSRAANRKDIATAISGKKYLDQPPELLEQVLIGRFPDGLGGEHNIPNRVDYDPFPWHSMAVWILTQMKRWGYIKTNVDYKKIAEEVFLAADCGRMMKELNYPVHSETYKKHIIMGKEFDPFRPDEYLRSFSIQRV
ncbi:nitrate/nitrite transport system substrate-binding protein [Gammaproteobacteria bacterium]